MEKGDAFLHVTSIQIEAKARSKLDLSGAAFALNTPSNNLIGFVVFFFLILGMALLLSVWFAQVMFV